MRIVILSIFIILNTVSLQSMNYNDYLNLKIGSIFVYNCTEWRSHPPTVNCQSVFRLKISITDTVSYLGKQYFTYSRQLLQISGTCSFSPFMFPFYVGNFNSIRMDSVSGNIYYYEPATGCNGETMLDSLRSGLNDTVKINCVPLPYKYICIDTTGKKKFDNSGIWWEIGTKKRQYDYQVGLVDNYYYNNQSGLQGTSQQTLMGRVVNGIVYGDTSMPFAVGINQLTSEVPEKFELQQNYPNPFNPTTKFGFRIADFGLVRLTVFDALGREVEVLVNQQLQPGTYEVDWNASGFPSGVYYYRLEAFKDQSTPSFNSTKKMVLLK